MAFKMVNTECKLVKSILAAHGLHEVCHLLRDLRCKLEQKSLVRFLGRAVEVVTFWGHDVVVAIKPLHRCDGLNSELTFVFSLRWVSELVLPCRRERNDLNDFLYRCILTAVISMSCGQDRIWSLTHSGDCKNFKKSTTFQGLFYIGRSKTIWRSLLC